MGVGSDIEAICRKCGKCWHVVIALNGGQIAQVECTRCHARHRYRATTGVATVTTPRATATKPGKPRARAAAKKPLIEANPNRPPRPFATSETYRVGDRIVHTSFGEGVVQAITGATKLEILFEAGQKTLVHSRGEG